MVEPKLKLDYLYDKCKLMRRLFLLSIYVYTFHKVRWFEEIFTGV